MRIDLSPEAFKVVENWTNDGASIACQHLDEVEDAILDESGEFPAERKLALIREIRLLKSELSVFDTKGGR